MHNLSMSRALWIWSDLEAAYFGKHAFGGDVAEIYIYRAMPYEPSVAAMHPGDEIDTNAIVRDAYDRANTSLHNLFTHFAEQQEALVEIAAEMDDGKPWRKLGEWLTRARYTHRIHVRVTPRVDIRSQSEVRTGTSGNAIAFTKQLLAEGASERQTAIVAKLREQAAYYQRQSGALAAVKSDLQNAKLCTDIADAIESGKWSIK